MVSNNKANHMQTPHTDIFVSAYYLTKWRLILNQQHAAASANIFDKRFPGRLWPVLAVVVEDDDGDAREVAHRSPPPLAPVGTRARSDR